MEEGNIGSSSQGGQIPNEVSLLPAVSLLSAINSPTNAHYPLHLAHGPDGEPGVQETLHEPLSVEKYNEAAYVMARLEQQVLSTAPDFDSAQHATQLTEFMMKTTISWLDNVVADVGAEPLKSGSAFDMFDSAVLALEPSQTLIYLAEFYRKMIHLQQYMRRVRPQIPPPPRPKIPTAPGPFDMALPAQENTDVPYYRFVSKSPVSPRPIHPKPPTGPVTPPLVKAEATAAEQPLIIKGPSAVLSSLPLENENPSAEQKRPPVDQDLSRGLFSLSVENASASAGQPQPGQEPSGVSSSSSQSSKKRRASPRKSKAKKNKGKGVGRSRVTKPGEDSRKRKRSEVEN